MLVATTGRLVDFLTSGHVRLGRVTCLVLDEADQLLTLGFSSQVCGQGFPSQPALPSHCLLPSSFSHPFHTSRCYSHARCHMLA